MLANYADILRLPGAKRFSLAGAILRMPMSMVGISIILTVKDAYGNYTMAGAVAAVSIIALSVCAPLLARLVDARGQRAVMLPSLLATSIALLIFTVAAFLQAPPWVIFVSAAVSGATWGAPGALVRSRWAVVVKNPQQLTTAYALEAAIDELVYIIGPIIATMLGTVLHPATGIILSVVFICIGVAGFFSHTASEPPLTSNEEKTHRSTVMRHPVVLGLALTYIGAGAMFGAVDVSVVAFTEKAGHTSLAGVMLGIFALGSLIAALIYGARTWYQSLWKLFAIGVVALAFGASSFLFATNLWVLGAAMLLTGLTIAPTMTNVNTIVSKVVPSTQLTEGLTWMSTTMNIGVSLGSLLGGRFIDTSGAAGGFTVVMVCAWIMVLLMLMGLPSLKKHTEIAAAESYLPQSPETLEEPAN
ncbi:MAG: MFS transporter [Actinobacteria bacterium]|nr:MAG: MFS transporter [Actinomycetota bacterium]